MKYLPLMLVWLIVLVILGNQTGYFSVQCVLWVMVLFLIQIGEHLSLILDLMKAREEPEQKGTDLTSIKPESSYD